MKKHLLLTFIFITVFIIPSYGQDYKPVKSFKADYYKDYVYPGTIAPGIPDVTPIEISATPNQWHNLPNGEAYPKNSLIPTEITTSAGTFTLNGVDADGTRHQFSAVRIILPPFSGGPYLRSNIEGYGGGTTHFKYTTQRNYNWYLTSGKHGMDLSTGITNIPTGAQISFGVILIDKDRIADGKPDFLFTQIATPENRNDYYEFVDENGVRVGRPISVNFHSPQIPKLGVERKWDFHQGDNSDNGQFDGSRELRMITFDISDFGIEPDEDINNPKSYKRVAVLKYTPSGTSDPAFMAADRFSLLAFKKLDATVNGEITVCQGETEYVTFEVASEGGQGDYRFTYDVLVDGVTTIANATITGETNSLGNYAKAQVAINTNNLGQITYKLKKVEDLGKGENKDFENQAHTVTIKDCSADYFVTTWKTTENNESVTIPTFSGTVSYDYVIQWEGIDNTSHGTITNVTGNKTIEFPTAGRYRVKIRGIFPYIYFNNSGDKDKILTVEQWGTIKWYSQENSYFGCKYLQISATDIPNFSEVTSFKNMFKEAYTVNSPNISTWNTPKAKNMEGMFEDARSFNQNLASWNMSAVTNINNMFRNSNMSANKLGLTLAGWRNGTNDLTNLVSPQQTLGNNLRYCNGGTTLTITNLNMPTIQCANDKEIGTIYLETTNISNNYKRLAGIVANGAFEWLEEDTKVESLTANTVPTEKGEFKLAEGTGVFDFNGIQLDIKKQIYSKNNVLRGFNSLEDEAIFPLANMTFTYKKEGSEDGFSYSEVEDNLLGKPLDEEGTIVYKNGHFYESIKVDSDNKPNPSGTLKWVRIDN